MLKALKKFQQTTTADYVPGPGILEDVYNAARVIGRRCRKAGPGPTLIAHVSLATAGSLNKTVSEGGRAQEVIDYLKLYLLVVPEENEEITLPFTVLRCTKGSPRWRQWCRETPYTEFPDVEFGDLTPEVLGGFEVFRQGFDEAIGDQILACAYLSYQDHMCSHDEKKLPIMLRVLPIPEPGGKTRIVTTGPYWLYVLQQSVAHVTRAYLASHPSAEGGMMRSDQAWQYLYLIRKASNFPKGCACLSSDLEEATDGIPHVIAMQLLRGFGDGLGIQSPLLEICTTLIGLGRLCLIDRDDSSFVSTRGVFMGEPLAKTILTLLNLSCEEIAIRKFLNVDFSVPVQESWRAFAVAGDDHIAYGPMEYLLWITEIHQRVGSSISKTKHAISTYYVRYCEKVLDVRNFETFKDKPGSINDSHETYLQSPFVDSIKVRLLSPCSKSNEDFNDRNTAIGKAKGCGNSIRWLSKEHFSMKWRSLVRDRLIQRMGPLLPDRSSGVYWHLLLPQALGGLGLYLEEDLPDMVLRLPDLSKVAVVEWAAGTMSRADQALFRGFTSNTSYRGYELLETEQSLAETLLTEWILPSLPSMTEQEATLLVGSESENLSQRQIITRLRSKMIYTEDEIKDQVLRPFLFKEILSREAKVKAFNTENLKQRYSRLWNLCYRGGCSLDINTLKEAIGKKLPYTFYDASKTTRGPIRGIEREYNLIEEATIGLPNLKIRWIEVGILAKPVNAPHFSYGEYV